METVERIDSLLGVVGRLKHDVGGTLRLKLGAGSQSHLANGTVLDKQVVQVSARDIKVSEVSR